jgi:hypothetical protein
MEGGMNASQFRSDIKGTDNEQTLRDIFDNYFGDSQTNPDARNRIFGVVIRGIKRI